ncbi:capsular associated protein [Mortierella sp. AD094]|nr:capsular associated protein [Mortierella sp. AD094]
MSLKYESPSRYLFALVIQDSSAVLPDLLSRILEAIAVLGPDHCHLSIVDNGSTDGTGAMLSILSRFLDLYNQGGVQSLDNVQFAKSDKNGGREPTMAGLKKKQRQLSYTITTLESKDNSPRNSAKIRNMALDPYFDIKSAFDGDSSQDQDFPTIKDKKTDAGDAESVGEDKKSPFDAVVVLDPIITCSEDILELIFQSQLQDADLTCGIDLDFTTELSYPAGTAEQGVYDSAITRDMLGQKLHQDSQQPDIFSNDPETQSRFQKRLPFQVESCWSGAIVLRSSALSLSSFLKNHLHPNEEIQQSLQQNSETQQCGLVDDRAAFCDNLWQKQSRIVSHEQIPGDPELVSSPSSSHLPRMVVVPSVGVSYSPKDYVGLGRFNAWGLWPKTEKKYRDDLEARLEAASHPTYGYKASTSSYGYSPRVEEEIQVPALDDDVADKSDDVGEEKVAKEVNSGLELLMIPEDMISALKSRLEEIMAVFGVKDIQNAILAKRDTELIGEWRDRPQPLQTREC